VVSGVESAADAPAAGQALQHARQHSFVPVCKERNPVSVATTPVYSITSSVLTGRAWFRHRHKSPSMQQIIKVLWRAGLVSAFDPLIRASIEDEWAGIADVRRR
jgi:hypothetical protein